MGKYVAVIVDGILTIHAHCPTGSYATLCGLDGDDPVVGQYPAEVPKGRKINCKECKSIVDTAREYQKSDFDIKE